jgi:hypothetical protein
VILCLLLAKLGLDELQCDTPFREYLRGCEPAMRGDCKHDHDAFLHSCPDWAVPGMPLCGNLAGVLRQCSNSGVPVSDHIYTSDKLRLSSPGALLCQSFP